MGEVRCVERMDEREKAREENREARGGDFGLGWWGLQKRVKGRKEGEGTKSEERLTPFSPPSDMDQTHIFSLRETILLRLSKALHPPRRKREESEIRRRKHQR